MTTPNLDLATIPQNSFNIAPGFNDAMKKLDVIVQLSALDNTLTTPPVTVAGDAGKRWIVAASATGAWSGKDGQIAYCTGATLWEFYVAEEGWICPVTSGTNAGKTYKFTGGAWVEAVAGGTVAASSVSYSNATSGLTATNAQAALDEIDADVDTLQGQVATAVSDVAAIKDQTDVTAPTISAGTLTLDLAASGFFDVALTANVTTLTLTNAPGAGKAGSWAVRLKQDATGGRTLALPASFKATGGSDSAPATAANAYTLLTFTTFDQGTRYEYAMQEVAA